MSRKPLCRTKRLAAAGGWLVLVVALAQLIALPLGALAWLDALDYERCGARLVAAPPAAALLRLRAEHKRASSASIHWQQQQQRVRNRTFRGNYGDYDDGISADYEYDDDDDANWSHRGERISVGYKAYAGEFPWFVRLQIKLEKSRQVSECGGVIIHSNLILTAAHCLLHRGGDVTNKITVMAGMHEEFQKWPHVQRVAGRRWIVPSGYDPGNFKDFKKPRHDMGLVELERPLEYNEFVQPACLPPEGSESPPNERCTLAGMGMTDKRRYSMHLLALPLKPCPRELPVFPDETCYITADPERFPGTACSGDSGTALMCPNEAAPGDRAARFYAIGITSWKLKETCEAGSVEEIYLADMRKKRSLLLDLLKKLAETSGRQWATMS